MIRVWTNKNRVQMEFKGTITEQINEMGYAMKEFANKSLKIDEVEFLKMFIVAYEEAAKEEIQDETNAGDEVRQDD